MEACRLEFSRISKFQEISKFLEFFEFQIPRIPRISKNFQEFGIPAAAEIFSKIWNLGEFQPRQASTQSNCTEFSDNLESFEILKNLQHSLTQQSQLSSLNSVSSRIFLKFWSTTNLGIPGIPHPTGTPPSRLNLLAPWSNPSIRNDAFQSKVAADACTQGALCLLVAVASVRIQP